MAENHKSIREIHQIGKETREYMVNTTQCPPLRRHGIILTGISLATRQFQFVRLNPNAHQILLCFRGIGEVWVNGRWQRCDPGMAYVTPAGQFCAYHGVGSKRWEVGWSIYSTAESPTLHRRWKSITEPILIEADPRPLEAILQGFYHEVSHKPNPETLEYWASLLDLQIGRILGPRAGAKLWQLWQRVQSDLAHPWTLEELARQSGLGIEPLRRICHRETGRSPMRQVTYLRMQHALSLLAANQKVAAVADAVGYETSFAFSIAFKRTIGRNPSAFNKG